MQKHVGLSVVEIRACEEVCADHLETVAAGFVAAQHHGSCFDRLVNNGDLAFVDLEIDIYFKVYKSQIPIIDQAIETAAMMLGSDKSRGYCLEMICADFLAGANLDNGQPDMLLHSLSHYYRFLPVEQKQAFMQLVNRDDESGFTKQVPMRLQGRDYEELRERVLRRDTWRCQFCGSRQNLEIHHQRFRSHSGEDTEENLITLCTNCHSAAHHASQRDNA